MTNITATAEAARESARHADGRFGAQENSPAEVSLEIGTERDQAAVVAETLLIDRYGSVDGFDDRGDSDVTFDEVHDVLAAAAGRAGGRDSATQDDIDIADGVLFSRFGGRSGAHEAIYHGEVDGQEMYSLATSAAQRGLPSWASDSRDSSHGAPATSPRQPELDGYWADVAATKGLSDDEQDALAAHVNEPDFQESLTVSTTTNQVIADALSPGTIAAFKASEAHDRELSDKIGADVTHATAYNDGRPMVVVRASTDDYLLNCVDDGDRIGYRINAETYKTAADIPTSRRKARQVALAFEANRDGIAESIRLHERRQSSYERWRAFDTAD